MKSDIVIEKIIQKLKDSDPNKRTLTKVFLFHFIDSNGAILKDYVFDFKNLKVYEGNVDSPDVDVTISDDDFCLVGGTKEISFEVLIETGRIQIKGDQEAFQKMSEKFKMNMKKISSE